MDSAMDAGIGATLEEAVDVGAWPEPVASFKVSKPGTESRSPVAARLRHDVSLVSPIVAASNMQVIEKGNRKDASVPCCS